MGEVRRYCLGLGEAFGGFYPNIVEEPSGNLVMFCDYDTLRAEVERLREYKQSMLDAIEEDRPEWARLREIERAAKLVIDTSRIGRDPRDNTYFMCEPAMMQQLAEACGRKG